MITNWVLQFWAAWCWPCKMLAPILSRVCLSQEISYEKVDIDENPVMTEKYEITAVPTTFIIKNWEVVDQFLGAKHEDDIVLLLKKYF